MRFLEKQKIISNDHCERSESRRAFMNEEFSQFDTLRMACLVLKMTNGLNCLCVCMKEKFK